MVKNFIHILRTYFITFRYIKKNEIFYSQFFTLFIVFLSSYIYLLSLLTLFI